MGIIKKDSIGENIHFLLWKIEEDEETLLPYLKETNCNFDHISNDNVRLESIAARVALYFLLEDLEITFDGLQKAENGKPHLLDNTFPISISHSKGFAAAVIDLSKNDIGIDIELIHPKVLRLLPRFANQRELDYAQSDNDNPSKATRIWTIKEAIYKAFGQLNIEFKTQIVTEFIDEKPSYCRIKKVNEDFLTFKLYTEKIESLQLSIAIRVCS